MEEEEAFGSKFNAYLCPNPGSSANMASRKQRLIFLEMDRTDPYSILDIGKIADIVLVVMSCKETNAAGVKEDPLARAKQSMSWGIGGSVSSGRRGHHR